jgi:hypothetical protein
LVALPSIIFAQLNIISFEENGVKFFISYNPRTYNIADTIEVKYSIINNSGYDLFTVIKPNNLIKVQEKETFCQIGSGWYYKPGWENTELSKIKNKSNYITSIFIVFNKMTTQDTLVDKFISYPMYIGAYNIINLYFSVGYFISSKQFKILTNQIDKTNDITQVTFKNDEDGFTVAENFRRVHIGTLHIPLYNH